MTPPEPAASVGRRDRFSLTLAQEKSALGYEPFFGDETRTTVLSDKFVATRTPHRCHCCSGPIRVGLRVRAMRERNDEEHKIMTWYWCRVCSWAMAISTDDAGHALTYREALRDVRTGRMAREDLKIFEKRDSP